MTVQIRSETHTQRLSDPRIERFATPSSLADLTYDAPKYDLGEGHDRNRVTLRHGDIMQNITEKKLTLTGNEFDLWYISDIARLMTVHDQKITFSVIERDPKNALVKEQEKRAENARDIIKSYKARIAYLSSEGVQDGIAVSKDSQSDFLRFTRSEPLLRKADIVMMDNGNLRAFWKDERGSHIGIQFLGGQMVQFVIFKLRDNATDTSRVAGRDSIDGVKKQILAFDLRDIMFS
jgi:hypothetical protein